MKAPLLGLARAAPTCALAMLTVLLPAVHAQGRPSTARAAPGAVARVSASAIRAGVDSMRQYHMDERPDLAIAIGRRLLRSAPSDARVRVRYIASLDQAQRFDELWAFVRRCNARPTDPWRMVECAYEVATRDHGWRAGFDSADVLLRGAVKQRPGDVELLLLATRLLVRRVEFSTQKYAPLVAFLDSASLQANGDYDVLAWRAAVRFDAASVSPADTAAQRAALRNLAELRRQQPDRVLAYRLATDRLMRSSPVAALPVARAAIALQPGAESLRTTFWRLLLRQPSEEPAAREAAVAADIASWLPAVDSSAAALLAASRQLRGLKRDSLARIVEDRLLARTLVSREADDVLFSRARTWSDSLAPRQRFHERASSRGQCPTAHRSQDGA